MTSTSWVYLVALLVSLAGTATLDWRWQLSLFGDRVRARRQAKGMAIAFAAFLVIDYIAIATGLFVAGHSEFATGVFLPGQMPIEEPLFLALLTYSAAMLVAANTLLRRGKN